MPRRSHGARARTHPSRRRRAGDGRFPNRSSRDYVSFRRMATKKASPPDDVLAQYDLSPDKWWWIDPPSDLRADPITVDFPLKKKTLTLKLYELPTKKRLVYYLGEDKKEGVGVW